jgi:hypothetical protein
VAGPERTATFDNDGMLWLLFAFDQVKQPAPQRSEWKTKEPFAPLPRGA